MAGEIDSANKFAVAVQGDKIRILAFGRSLTFDEAMNLAAWLVCLAQATALVQGDEFSGETEFDAWLNAVRAT